MFEEFYEMYESEEQEVVALINRCIGGGFNWKGNFWEMTVVTLGIVSYRANWPRKRTSFSKNIRRSPMPYLSMVTRSTPMPKAKPLTSAG